MFMIPWGPCVHVTLKAHVLKTPEKLVMRWHAGIFTDLGILEIRPRQQSTPQCPRPSGWCPGWLCLVIHSGTSRAGQGRLGQYNFVLLNLNITWQLLRSALHKLKAPLIVRGAKLCVIFFFLLL